MPPPSGELASLLRSLALPGAPALAITPLAERAFEQPVPLPLTAPPISDDRHDRLGQRLKQLRLGERPLHPDAIRRLGLLLALPERDDGLSGWNARAAKLSHRRYSPWFFERQPPTSADRLRAENTKHVWNVGDMTGETTVVVSTASPKRHDRSVGRSIFAAVDTDLLGSPLEQVSRVLRLSTAMGDRRKGTDESRARGAERERRRGRSVLALLGAWPWVHAPAGALPQGWHTERRFIGPLSDWHRRADAELRKALADAARAASDAATNGQTT